MKKLFCKSLIAMVCAAFSLFLFSHCALSQGDDAAEPQPLELDGTEWDVLLKSASSEGVQKEIADTLIFEDGTFTSKHYSSKDFEPVNYRLQLKGGISVWSGMLMKEDARVFWRGDFSDESMRGVVSVQTKLKETADYAYHGKMTKGVLKERTPEEPPLPQTLVEEEEKEEEAAEKAEPSEEAAAMELKGPDKDEKTMTRPADDERREKKPKWKKW
ncbi:MAG: hypothetical protein ABIJ27_07630 [Candidatus Omnitrophota bacterium]